MCLKGESMQRRRMATIAIAVVAALGVTLHAQHPAGRHDQTAKQNEKAETTTLTGCVAAGTEPGTFTLTNVTREGAAATKGAPAGTSGTVKPMADSVMLMGSKVDLSKHAGHKVSVTGTPSDHAASGNHATTEKPGDHAKTPATGTAQTMLTVTSLKMVATSCGQ